MYSYDPAHATPLDRIRFALGDTSEEGAMLSDETISAEIVNRGEQDATSYLAMGLAARFARDPDRIAIPDGPSVSWSRVAALQRAAAQAGGTGGGGRGYSLRAVRDDGEIWSEYQGVPCSRAADWNGGPW